MTVPATTSASPSAAVRTLQGCARAASAAESRFRIQRPIAPARAARVIALDDAAAGVLSRLADRPWAHARFYLCEHPAKAPLALREIGGPSFALADELAGTDVVVVVAAGPVHADEAAAIGRICAARAITTAGVVLASGDRAEERTDTVAALRPYARVLLPTADEGDLAELLTALRV